MENGTKEFNPDIAKVSIRKGTIEVFQRIEDSKDVMLTENSNKSGVFIKNKDEELIGLTNSGTFLRLKKLVKSETKREIHLDI